ncbi:putative 2-succinylbenzoate--CoA ligase, chloroplastic/peroxisomal [Cocos nucifera]|nr:putative 2-succinylbenzoate--CoA ligase, chloroplastic/peroxisomal [Cocos nucifera]
MAQSQGHICLCLGRILALRRDSLVAIAGRNRRTGGEFVDGVLNLARGLVESGVRKGDIVAIAALNSDWYVELLLAVTYVGGIAAPLNYRWVYLHTAPLCHIGGISSCIAMLMAGGCHVFIPKFDAKSCFQAIEQLHVTSFITVPAMIADLISCGRKANAWNNRDSITKILNGGGGLSEELKKGASCLFPRAKIISAYGMTEACSSLTFLSLHDPSLQQSGKLLPVKHKVELGLRCHQQNGVCVGKPAPHIEIRISGSCKNSHASSIGRILTRGLHVMVGYWDQTQVMMLDSIDQGWLDTGDIGWIDCNGDLWLIGREKDRIKSGGENVYPEEIEALLLQHPGVHSAVVVGIPDFRLMEKVVACVAIRDDWEWVDQKSKCLPEKKQISTDILHNYCVKGNLSRFKAPKAYIPWRKPFPITSTGKLKREDIRKEVVSYMQLHSNL